MRRALGNAQGAGDAEDNNRIRFQRQLGEALGAGRQGAGGRVWHSLRGDGQVAISDTDAYRVQSEEWASLRVARNLHQADSYVRALGKQRVTCCFEARFQTGAKGLARLVFGGVDKVDHAHPQQSALRDGASVAASNFDRLAEAGRRHSKWLWRRWRGGCRLGWRG